MTLQIVSQWDKWNFGISLDDALIHHLPVMPVHVKVVAVCVSETNNVLLILIKYVVFQSNVPKHFQS